MSVTWTRWRRADRLVGRSEPPAGPWAPSVSLRRSFLQRGAQRPLGVFAPPSGGPRAPTAQAGGWALWPRAFCLWEYEHPTTCLGA